MSAGGNREGSTIPLRADLANALNLWLSDIPTSTTIRLGKHEAANDSSRKLFRIPAGLVRILNRDLLAAGIKKKDERDRTIDVHAPRHSFGTLLSKGGVASRTAQVAMRHNSIDLTMNVYADPILLDVHGALDALPSLNLNSSPAVDRQTMRATGTDDCNMANIKDIVSGQFAPEFAPNSGKLGQTVSLAVISPIEADDQRQHGEIAKVPRKQTKKPHPQGLQIKASKIGMTGD